MTTGKNIMRWSEVRPEYWPECDIGMDQSEYGGLDATDYIPAGAEYQYHGICYIGALPQLNHREGNPKW